MNIVYFLLIGLLSGWIAGMLMKGRGFGLLGNMVVGILGAVAGGFLFDLVGLTWGGTLGAIGTSVIGAVVLLFTISLFKKTN
ncbi:MAG: GlsB/YeaQ/YmgE family stress response membrane protein [Phycisphaerales bacterium]|nr:GlsB/YeaQ/YmgE family stress response membrane protein [Phycisphaerales bacterium]